MNGGGSSGAADADAVAVAAAAAVSVLVTAGGGGGGSGATTTGGGGGVGAAQPCACTMAAMSMPANNSAAPTRSAPWVRGRMAVCSRMAQQYGPTAQTRAPSSISTGPPSGSRELPRVCSDATVAR